MNNIEPAFGYDLYLHYLLDSLHYIFLYSKRSKMIQIEWPCSGILQTMCLTKGYLQSVIATSGN